MKETNLLKDIVYQMIMNGILSDEYKPNQIITERELIEKCNFSKSPIREALIMLCNENVLISHPRYGYEIVRLTNEYVKHTFEYRYILERSLLQKSYQYIGEAELQELSRLDTLCKEHTDLWEHWEANAKFHLVLASYAGNSYAVKQLSGALSVIKRAYAQFNWIRWNTMNPRDDVRYHEALLQSLREKNLTQILTHLQNDFNDFEG